MTLLAETLIEVIDSFKSLQTAIAALNAQIMAEDSLVAWMQANHELCGTATLSARAMAVRLFSQLEYLPGQDPKSILLQPGLLGASEHTLALAKTLNNSKDAFKAAIKQLKAREISLRDTALITAIEPLLNKRPQSVQQGLQRSGLARLHLKQCYRKIPILPAMPSKVSWTWANTRAIKKISRAQAEELLLQKNEDEGIRRQLRKLAALAESEPLAIVQELAPHLRANLVFQQQDSEAVSRMMVKGPMPLLFPATTASSLPQFKPPKEKAGRNSERLQRSDTKLDPCPYLPAIRAHRYLSFSQP